ncbi:hypothetical protein [Tahibacter amnicola]|uniref:WD40 repeat protein n=1 Tax=Tahibacter amnicola TaxID=2976241 RepID=A0ABY6BHR8_9GAMM|nr:hypothetical protein [Tahibacter amnicola]UXI69544.1 hypothetical protein N4264_07840 [Tahibacter amnicola]
MLKNALNFCLVAALSLASAHSAVAAGANGVVSPPQRMPALDLLDAGDDNIGQPGGAIAGTAGTILAFDITTADVATDNRAKLFALSENGEVLHQKAQQGPRWGAWKSNPVVNVLGDIGVTAIRSFSHGPNAFNQPKEYALSSNGTEIYSRTFNEEWYEWGPWVTSTVESLGIPGVTTIRSFDQEGRDAAIGRRLKETVVSGDGRTIYFRFYENQTWGAWYAASVAAQIPGLVAIRSFSQGITPSGLVRQDMLSDDGRTVYFRVFQNGAWGPWHVTPVGNLQVPETP